MSSGIIQGKGWILYPIEDKGPTNTVLYLKAICDESTELELDFISADIPMSSIENFLGEFKYNAVLEKVNADKYFSITCGHDWELGMKFDEFIIIEFLNPTYIIPNYKIEFEVRGMVYSLLIKERIIQYFQKDISDITKLINGILRIIVTRLY